MHRKKLAQIKICEVTDARIDFLKQMDNYIRYKINDENIIEEWITYGLPDGYDDIDLMEIATDDDLWLDCVNCFTKCRKMGKKLKIKVDRH